MKVRCIDNEYYENLLSIGKEYEIIAEYKCGEYRILNDANAYGSYCKSRFTPIKEEVMKIREWKELDGKNINGNRISVSENNIRIDFDSNPSVGMIINTGMKQSEIIAHLALLGIEVEFEKPMTITQNDYNWLVAMRLGGDFRIKRDTTCGCLKINSSNVLYTLSILENLEIGKEYLVSDLLKMKVEG